MTPAPLFWFAALALVAAALASLLWPLLRRRDGTRDMGPEDLAAAASVYRDQRRQLDEDLAAGAITADEHKAALDELASRLSAEVASTPGAVAGAPSRAPWIAALALVAVLPAAAVLAYLGLGNPAALTPSPHGAAAAQGVSDEQVRAMVESLAQKMKANPGDPNGWLLLARSYSAMGRFPDAVDAYKQAAERGTPDAQLYADWADAAAMTQGRKLAGAPEALVVRALALDPKNPKALALSATARLERGDVAGSLVQWRELRALLPNGSDDAREIDTVIAQLDGQQLKLPGGTASASAMAAAPSAPSKPAPGVATAPPIAPGAVSPHAAPGAAAGPALTGRIELDPKLAARVAPDDTVFVLARAAEGPRMPLAVQKFRAAELPRAFRLDDSMAMAPGMTVSSRPSVVVEARVSKSGNAITQPGDVRGTTAPVAPGTGDLRIVIGEVVP